MEEFLAVFLFGSSCLVVCTACAIRIVNGPRRGKQKLEPPAPGAMEILNEQYALGRIDRDEYLERRAFIEDVPALRTR